VNPRRAAATARRKVSRAIEAPTCGCDHKLSPIDIEIDITGRNRRWPPVEPLVAGAA